MKKLELVFYCCNPREKCPKAFCVIDGYVCLFLKAQWETRLKILKKRKRNFTLGDVPPT